ncbi:MAG TPA: biotin/lipoyl-containing protein [Vicinamibacterales bacterium]|nr:biotin/lipoyl-containing protein [Vicinamibacterales bacterium]
MIVEVDINGRVRTVSIEPAGAGYRVTVDGRARMVDAVRLDPTTLSLLFVDEGGASWTVGVAGAAPGGGLSVSIDGTTLSAAVSARRGAWGRRAAAAADGRGPSGPQRLVAPMPGKVVRLLVRPGDTVKARQPMIVVEAMKMENEIRSPKAGVVAEIRVAEGTSVEAGSLLAVVD